MITEPICFWNYFVLIICVSTGLPHPWVYIPELFWGIILSRNYRTEIVLEVIRQLFLCVMDFSPSSPLPNIATLASLISPENPPQITKMRAPKMNFPEFPGPRSYVKLFHRVFLEFPGPPDFGALGFPICGGLGGHEDEMFRYADPRMTVAQRKWYTNLMVFPLPMRQRNKPENEKH